MLLSQAKEKSEWLLNFMLDPASGGHSGYNQTEKKFTAERKMKEEWLLETQLAGAGYYNSAEAAAAAIPFMESDLPDNEGLRAAGFRVYKYIHKQAMVKDC